MALTSDTFIERSQLKRQVTFWRLVAVGVLTFFIVILIERNAKIPDVSKKDEYVARLTIDGTIDEDRKLYKLLDKIKEDDEIRAVILHLNTPGGVAAAGETLHRKISEIRDIKPVVASMRSVCASAGYMISLAADHVLAMPSTITGSIGVIFQSAEFSELADKVGVNPIIVKSGRYKGSPSTFNPMTDSERAIIQSLIDDFHEVFIKMVAEGRELPVSEVRDIADGRVYSAPRALELDLIDGLGGEGKARDWLESEHGIPTSMEIRNMEAKSKVDRILDKVSQQAGISQLTESGGIKSGLMLLWRPHFAN